MSRDADQCHRPGGDRCSAASDMTRVTERGSADVRNLKADRKLVVESQRRVEIERRRHSRKGKLPGGLEADASRAPEAILGLLHVPVVVAEMHDAGLVGFVEV